MNIIKYQGHYSLYKKYQLRFYSDLKHFNLNSLLEYRGKKVNSRKYHNIVMISVKIDNIITRLRFKNYKRYLQKRLLDAN